MLTVTRKRSRHISAMTEECLHGKADIAAELGWRDQQIYDLSCKVYYRDEQLTELKTQIEGLHLLLMLPERFRPAIDAYAARLREEQAKHLATLQRKLDPE